MTCSECGQELPPNSVYCPHCGQQAQGAEKDKDSMVVGDAPAAAGGSHAGTDAAYREEELWIGRYSPRAMLGTSLAAGAVVIGLVAVGAVVDRRDVWATVIGAIAVIAIALGAVTAYRRMRIRYRLTTQRFIQEQGIVWLETDRIDIIDINDIRVEQGPIQRMFGLGTIIVMANDRTHPNLHMAGIEDVNHVADMMDNARRAIQRRRGLRIDVASATTDAADPTT